MKRKAKKVSKFRYWTAKELRVVRRFYRELTNRQIARRLARSPRAIQAKGLSLGLHKNSQQWWTEGEIKKLKKLYRNRSSREAARRLKRTVRSVEIKASKLGLTKTRAYLRARGYNPT